MERPLNCLSELEICALKRVSELCPEEAPGLLDWLPSCIVSKRENTGHGFFTYLMPDASPLGARSPMGEVWLAIEGMKYGICCTLFSSDGHPSLLEAYAVADEDTSKIDFNTVRFVLRDAPPTGATDDFDVAR